MPSEMYQKVLSLDLRTALTDTHRQFLKAIFGFREPENVSFLKNPNF